MTTVVSPNLVRQAQSGNKDAVNEVLTSVDRVVNRLARKGGVQHADVEDRAQEIRLAVWQKALPKWEEDGGASFSTWAWWWGNSKVRVIRTSEARKPKQFSLKAPEQALSRERTPRTPTSTLTSLLGDQTNILDKLDLAESCDLLHKAFNYLADDEKLLLSLRYWEGWTLREVSRASKRGEIDLRQVVGEAEQPGLSHQGCLSLERRAIKHLESILTFLTRHRAERARTAQK